MPELPEVETICRDLSAVVLNEPIVKVDVRLAKMVRGENIPAFQKELIGNHFSAIGRRGKLLIFTLKSGAYLLIHLKMTGQLIYQAGQKVIAGGHAVSREDLTGLPHRQTHLIFTFKDGSNLFFNDLRQFGYVQIVDQAALDKVVAGFGIEPLTSDFTLERFVTAIRRRPRSAIKAVLLDQKLIAGIGNIYADEVCFAAKIRPARPAVQITDKELEILWREIPRILKLAIKHRGTTFDSYRDAHGDHGSFRTFLQVYGRAGQKCVRNDGGILLKTRVAGRGTVYCPVCQK